MLFNVTSPACIYCDNLSNAQLHKSMIHNNIYISNKYNLPDFHKNMFHSKLIGPCFPLVKIGHTVFHFLNRTKEKFNAVLSHNSAETTFINPSEERSSSHIARCAFELLSGGMYVRQADLN